MRFVAIIAACSIAMTAGAQTKKTSALEDGLAFARAAWTNVQKQTSAATESWPKRIREIRNNITGLADKVNDFAKTDLPQRKALALELWRVHDSIDFLTLINPDVLQTLTGLDLHGLQNMTAQFQKVWSNAVKKGLVVLKH